MNFDDNIAYLPITLMTTTMMKITLRRDDCRGQPLAVQDERTAGRTAGDAATSCTESSSQTLLPGGAAGFGRATVLLPAVLLLTVSMLLLLVLRSAVPLRIARDRGGGGGGGDGGGGDDTPNTHYRHRGRVRAVPVTVQRARRKSPEITRYGCILVRSIFNSPAHAHVANAIRGDR